MSASSMYIPANHFWHHVLNCPLNRPLTRESLASIREIRFGPSILFFAFSDDRPSSPIQFNQIDDIPQVQWLTGVKKLELTFSSFPPSYSATHRLLCLLSQLPSVEELTIVLRNSTPPFSRYLHNTLKYFQPVFDRLLSLQINFLDCFAPDPFLVTGILSHPMPHLKNLDLIVETPWSALTVQEFPALETLSVSGFSNAPSLCQIADHFPNLEELSLYQYDCAQDPDAYAAPIHSTTSLRKLKIRNSFLEPQNLAGLETLNLEFLQLDNVYFDPAPLAHLTSLRELHVTNCALQQPMPSLRALHELELLELADCNLKDLELIRGLKELKMLRLQDRFFPLHEKEEDYPPEAAALETLPALLSIEADFKDFDVLAQSKPVAQRFTTQTHGPGNYVSSHRMLIRR